MTSSNVAKSRSDSSLSAIVGRVARLFESGAIHPGEMASLRRLDPAAPPGACFWKMMVLHVSPAAELSLGQESAWAMVLAGMARMAPICHAPHRRVGRVLAENGFSELRFERLLRARGATLAQTSRILTSFLASRGEAVDWTQLARFHLSEDPSKAAAVRREMARDYYVVRSLKEKERENS